MEKPEAQVIAEVLTALAQIEARLEDWERSFLRSVSTQTYPLTERQRPVLVALAEQYLDDQLLAAAVRAQLRLLV